MHGTHQCDICCLNFLKHKGFCALFILHSVPLSLPNSVPKELDLVKIVERKGGTVVQMFEIKLYTPIQYNLTTNIIKPPK